MHVKFYVLAITLVFMEHYTVRCQGDVAIGWGDWSPWSRCSVTCGSGIAVRMKVYRDKNGNSKHVFTDTVECTSPVHCPVHGAWGYWGEWTECSVMCDGGVQSRERKCDEPKPMFDGNDCYGAKWEGRQCGKLQCPELPLNFSMLMCQQTSFICESKQHCVSMEARCDGKLDCHDGTDEKHCFRSMLRIWNELSSSKGQFHHGNYSVFVYIEFCVIILVLFLGIEI